MPRKKNSRRSAAQKQVMERRMSVKSGKGWDEGVSSPAGPSGPVPLADITAMPSHHLVCLAKDEGLTTPTDRSRSVPLVDLSSRPSALQGCKLSDGGKAHPTCLSHSDIDRLVHSCPRWMAVSSEPNDTSLYTSQRNSNETSQETVNDTNHRIIYSRNVNETSHETISETSHETVSETSHETCSEAQRTCPDMQRICPDISETIIETCYNNDPESLKIVETSCLGTKIFDTEKYGDVLENADTDNAQKSDTSNFLNQFIHYTATPLSNEADVRSSLQLQAVPSHCIIIQQLHSVMRQMLGHLCNFKLYLHIALHLSMDPSIRQIVCSAKCHVEVSVL